ncbi:methyltransferase family protein [Desulfovibrio ferrophilus]|uniref:Protein-S-isoprenylcysteine O-methyltransferase-like protein n=1 Tax=Desulfovibrio ferrophilus TaxID=241368 RepID=A0A2Z6AZK4_9BACT|nr:isoprenylcysteine carboxylmethyltransferase family protein [Desulfovibrio ferrophilus]BBD08615.1 protein-S-isoprenylcysteine O-methyltransferase-like protein [Desulfovibrio ferrophilus]
MRRPVVEVLLRLAGSKPGPMRKALSLAIGAALFLCGIPLGLLMILEPALQQMGNPWPRWLEITVGAPSLISSILLLSWAVRTQWKHGGTPAPTAPTQRLITTGPYARTRNPIQLGAMLYWMGLMTLISSLTAGLIGFLFGLLAGSFWHRHVEEHELAARFGPAYDRYRRKVPFLFPRIWPRR